MNGMILVLFCLGVLLIFILIVIAATGPTNSRQTRVNIDRTSVSTREINDSQTEAHFQPVLTPPPDERARVSEEMFVPRRLEAPARPTPQWIPQAAPKQRIGLPDQIRNFIPPEPTFGGREQINWDARCRLTGETHRVCSCTECKSLRRANGFH